MSLPISPEGRRYGYRRDFFDLRDQWHEMPKKAARVSLPSAYDGREYCGAVKDQGAEGSCTGHAGAELGEWIDRKYRHKETVYSPQFVYSQNLISEGTFPQDQGAMPRTICQTLSMYGLCEEKEFPYVAGGIARPSTQQLANAATHKLGGYHRLNGLGEVRLALGDPTPWPVLLAFQVYESFESHRVAETGIMPTPDVSREACLGGHEVLCVGYDDNRGFLIIQNSWGDSWGTHGFFLMPYTVAANPRMVSDLWTQHPGYWGVKS